ncbi:MAG: 30S ribosomal protein S6 [Oscillospiraceae bacterium]|jgi:small subunit ribosomal protein S6|nr:30S ribosomal protein S6 [Oscillospiraceae bacterium]
MAKLSYETVIVFSVKEGEEAVKALTEKFQALIEANGTIDSVDVWGTRRLAYPINYETEGYYVLFNYQAEPEFPAELDRVIKITDGVLRSLIVKKGE